MTEKLQLTVLCDDFCPKAGLLGEHGFSLLIQTDKAAVLFDTGQGLALRHNAAVLKADKLPLEAVVISHGHDDHAGGLKILSECFPHPIKVYIHPEAFIERYKYVDEQTSKPTGIPFERQQLKDWGLQFCFISQPCEVAADVWATGYIPRDFVEPEKMTHYVKSAGGRQADAFPDDQALAVKTEKGIVVILGCAHAGVEPTVEYIKSIFPGEKILAVLGGMHLLRSDDQQVLRIADYLNRQQVELLAVSHCTGVSQSVLLGRNFKGQFMILGVGSKVWL